MAAKDNETKKQSGSASGSSGDNQEPEAQASARTRQKSEEIREEADALVDQIDEILEVNAETFVKSFIQKGGE